jgi:hypothetical protein
VGRRLPVDDSNLSHRLLLTWLREMLTLSVVGGQSSVVSGQLQLVQ